MKKIKIKAITYKNGNAEIIGEYEGENIFQGFFGGEPEDNSRERDYSWVEDAIAVVAELGGIKIEYEESEE